MRKVLIITHLAQSYPRIIGLAKYLTHFGWQPIILTTPFNDDLLERYGYPREFRTENRIIETPGYVSTYGSDKVSSLKSRHGFIYNMYRKKSLKPFFRFLYKRYTEIRDFPDSDKEWKHFGIKSADDYLLHDKIDAIISISPPVTSHLIAKELSKKYAISWIADLGDLWSQNINYPYSRFRKIFDKRIEKDALRYAGALVTVSEPWSRILRTLHKNKEVYTIENGFDFDETDENKVGLTSNFTITYTGQLYGKEQKHWKFLIALSDLVLEGVIDRNDVEVRFYGRKNELLENDTEKYGLKNVVKQYGIIPRGECLVRQRESQILLVINWESLGESGAQSCKIFEYLAAKRPILACGGLGNDVVERLLNETNAGFYCASIDNIKNVLKTLYVEFKTDGKVNYNENLINASKYSYHEMTRKFAKILSDCSV